MKLKYLALIMIGLAGLGLQQAKADVFHSSLNVGNTGLNGFSGPFGTVTITLINSTTATVTFTSNTVNGNTYLFGDSGAVALNVNATSFSVSNLAGTGPNGTVILSQNVGGNEDGFGNFNLRINDFDGFSHAASTITFTLTNTSGTWASAANVLIFNALGFDAAAHIFVTTNGGTTNTSVTGFAAENIHGIQTPDGGATVMLLGAALSVLGVLRRRLIN